MNQKLQESLMISSTDTNPLGIQSPKGSIGGSRTKKEMKLHLSGLTTIWIIPKYQMISKKC